MTRIPGEDDELPIDLSLLDGEFEEAPVASRSIPDGSYEVSVERVELLRAARSGEPMIKWTLLVYSLPFHGRRLWRHLVLSTKNLPWLKRDLETAGVRLDKLSDLPRHLDDLRDIRLKVTKRTRDSYENVFFVRRLPG